MIISDRRLDQLRLAESVADYQVLLAALLSDGEVIVMRGGDIDMNSYVVNEQTRLEMLERERRLARSLPIALYDENGRFVGVCNPPT